FAHVFPRRFRQVADRHSALVSSALPLAYRAWMMERTAELTMTAQAPERANIADSFLDARVREGRGARVALRTDAGTLDYAGVQTLAPHFGHALAAAGVEPEHRVLIALPDGPEFVAAFFGTLKLGAVVVMVNPALPQGDIEYILECSRARAIVAQ